LAENTVKTKQTRIKALEDPKSIGSKVMGSSRTDTSIVWIEVEIEKTSHGWITWERWSAANEASIEKYIHPNGRRWRLVNTETYPTAAKAMEQYNVYLGMLNVKWEFITDRIKL